MLPFGGGRHLCPGRFFSMLEVLLAVCFAVARCEVELPPSTTLPPKFVELSAPVNAPKVSFPAQVRWSAA